MTSEKQRAQSRKYGFQKGHPDFVPSESRKIIGIKSSQTQKGKPATKGSFKKGYTATEEMRRKMSEKGKGREHPNRKSPPPFSKKHREKLSKTSKGRQFSEETREKISKLQKGDKNPAKRPEIRKKLSKTMMGMFVKEKHWNWKGGITPFRVKIWSSLEYRSWRLSVFERDEFTCQKCKEKGGRLNAHHIQSWSNYPELRFVVSNGITLCKECHDEFHRRYGMYTNRQQIEEFLSKEVKKE